MKWKTLGTILATATLLTGGCFYKEPLVKEHTIPIDPALLGLWTMITEENEPPEDVNMLFLQFSETEYLIHSLGEDENIYYRAYPIEIGGIACLQLQIIGGGDDGEYHAITKAGRSARSDDELDPFLVMKIDAKDDCIQLSMLNDKVVSYKLKTTKELQQVFLDNINNEKLFDKPARFQRSEKILTSEHLTLNPVATITDATLSDRASANPIAPEIAVVVRTGEVRIYDYTGQIIKTLSKDGQSISSVAHSPTGKLLAGTRSGGLMVWDKTSNDWNDIADLAADAISRVAWLGNNAAWGRGVRYYGTKSKPINRDKSSGGTINPTTRQSGWTFQSFIRADFQTLSASAEGTRLAVLDVPGKPKGVCLLDGETGEIKTELVNGKGPLSACISPDGKTVAVGYAPHGVVLWNAEDGSVLKNLTGHSNWVVSLAFSPDGKHLISGSGDSTARIWSVESGEEIGRLRFKGSSTYAYSVGFSPNGQRIYALVEDGALHIAESPFDSAETEGDK